MLQKISILIVDDSALLRRVLKDKLVQYRGLDIVGEAINGKDAVEKNKLLNPDIILLDCEMPVMDGVTALKMIIKDSPERQVIMFSNQTSLGSKITIQAMEIGASDFLAKPTEGLAEMDSVINRLVAKIRFVSVRKKIKAIEEIKTKSKKEIRNFSGISKRNIKIIGVGSSTGGVKAALEIVPHFPVNSPPVVWVQHMPASFTNSFANRLNDSAKIRFVEAKDGDILKKGTGYLAPGAKQIKVLKNKKDEYVLKIDEKLEKISGHKPSADSLFMSLAEIVNGSDVLALILTGMGSDGAKGLKMLHDKGAYVIGQNEQSCVVYGMPRSAMIIGAVDIEVDIVEIPYIIEKILGEK